jgi:hypothetical protein
MLIVLTRSPMKNILTILAWIPIAAVIVSFCLCLIAGIYLAIKDINDVRVAIGLAVIFAFSVWISWGVSYLSLQVTLIP